MAQNFVESAKTVLTADGDSVSAAFQIRKDAMFVGLLLGTLVDNANVTLTVCATLAGTYAPVLDPLDGADLVIAATGEDPCYIDISNYIMAIPSTYYFKLAYDVAQATGSTGNVATLLEKS
jgi:hypothetical protein